MAFETLTPLISYPADGVTTTFAIPDKFYDASDVKLFFVDAAGLEGQFDFGTDYSVVITATDPTPPARKSGNVVLVTPPAIGISLVVFIWPDSDQDQPFEGQPVTPRQNERVHDRHAMRDASLRELLFRGFRAPLNAPPALRYIEVGAPGRVPVYAPDGSGSLVEGPTVGEVLLVSEIVPEIIAVAAISAQVVAVAGNSANINIVAGNITNVNLVGANIASVVTVAANITPVNVVATNITSVNTIASNMAALLAVPGAAAASAAAAAGSAGAAASSAAAALASENVVALAGVPAGTIIMRFGPLQPGFIAMGEGGTFDRAVYPGLATWLDNNGASLGLSAPQIAAGTLPDWRDYSPRTAGGALGPAVGALQLDAVQLITGEVEIPRSVHITAGTGALKSRASASTGAAAGAGTPYQIVSFDNSASPGARTATETRAKTFGVRWQIKAYGAVVNQGTADLVAIEQHYQTLANGALRKDIDQNAQAESAAYKINILKNTLQAWEVVPNGAVAVGTSVASITWAGLSAYRMLRLKGLMIPTVDNANLYCRVGAGAVDTASVYGIQSLTASSSVVNAGSSSPNYMQAAVSGVTANTATTVVVDLSIIEFNKPRAARMLSLSAGYSGATLLGIIYGYHNTIIPRDIIQVYSSVGLIGANSFFVLEGMRG